MNCEFRSSANALLTILLMRIEREQVCILTISYESNAHLKFFKVIMHVTKRLGKFNSAVII